ncbi:hypothetical protein QE152_g6805 [Popillia japonica]|uniref:Uncharacterized protein n=1 Tax=Popillia japonica TaxID=7064 RepID=A0AAW1MDZ6_POPJA
MTVRRPTVFMYDPIEKAIWKSRDVVFVEDITGPSRIKPASEEEFLPSQAIHPEQEIRRSERIPKPKLYEDYLNYNVKVSEVEDPSSIERVFSKADKELWLPSMKEEYDSLLKNKTLELCDLPVNKRPINCKWVFKTKRVTPNQVEDEWKEEGGKEVDCSGPTTYI